MACLNLETASFLKEVARKFTINELLFRAWGKTEFENRTIFSGHLAGTCWQKRKPLDTIKWILNLNGLKNLEFYIISWLKTPQGVFGIAKLKLEKKVINSTSFDSQAVINPENGDGKETAE